MIIYVLQGPVLNKQSTLSSNLHIDKRQKQSFRKRIAANYNFKLIYNLENGMITTKLLSGIKK